MPIEQSISLILGTVTIAVLSIFIVLFIIRYTKMQNRLFLEKQALKQALLEAEVEIRDQTLADLSRELHDNFGQILTLAKINLSMLPNQDTPENQEKLSNSIELVGQLINDMSKLSTELSQTDKQFSIKELIKRDIKRTNASGYLHIESDLGFNNHDLNKSTAILIYRIFQEILNNTLKHANAKNAFLKIAVGNRIFHMEYSDDGRGFDKTKTLSNQNKGLKNIRHRCHILGAELYIGNHQSTKGALIKLQLPLE